MHAGLITGEQSQRITAFEQRAPAPTTPTRRSFAVAEALGYLGGALILGAAVALTARYWTDVAFAGRIALNGAAAVALLGAGFAARPATAQGNRLRAVLWLASAGASAVFAFVVVRDGMNVSAGHWLAFAPCVAIAVESGLLWRGRHLPVQQLAFLSAASGATAAALAGHPGRAALAVMVVGTVLLVLGLRRAITSPVPTEFLAAIDIVGGAMAIGARWTGAGLLLTVAACLALLALALAAHTRLRRPDRVAVGAPAATVLAASLPQTLGYFALDAAAATGMTVYVLAAASTYVAARKLVVLAPVVEILAAMGVLGGAALTFHQWHGIAPVLGVATSAVFVGLGMLPGQLGLSLVGSLGLLVNIPWTLVWFFPGPNRVPMLALVCGALIIIIAVMLMRRGADHPGPTAGRPAGGAPGRRRVIPSADRVRLRPRPGA